MFRHALLACLLFITTLSTGHAQIKISDLPAAGAALGGDIMPMSNLSRSTTQSYGLTVGNLLTSGLPVSAGATVFNNSVSATSSGAWVVSPSAGTVTMNPTAGGTINNMSIGATTPSTGAFTSATTTGVITAGASVNAPAYILTSSGVNAQTGTTYTLLTSDNGKVVTLNNASAITLTVPSGLGAAFTATIVQLGAGLVTLSASGTTLNFYSSATGLAGRYASASIICYTANTCVISGQVL